MTAAQDNWGWRLSLAVATCLLAVGLRPAQRAPAQAAEARMRTREAAPPQWTQRQRELFFDDVQRHVGPGELPRPRPDSAASAEPSPDAAQVEPAAASASAGAAGWEAIISAATLEDEIKLQVSAVAEAVRTPTAFKSGGFNQARKAFSMLAVLFAVISEYDGRVRWQKQAQALRDLTARAGFNCKAASDAAFKEARLRSDDLAAVLRGATIDALEPNASDGWPRVTDRPPLMTRMELAQRDRIPGHLASEAELRGHAAEVVHEAEMLTMLAAVICQEGYEYAEEESYQGYSRQLQAAAAQLRSAAEQLRLPAAQAALGEINKSCTACHGDFRS